MKIRWCSAALVALIVINASCADKGTDDSENRNATGRQLQEQIEDPRSVVDRNALDAPLDAAQADLAAELRGGTEDLPASEVADRLETTLVLLQNAVNNVPTDTFDPKAVVHMLGHDPVRLFEWVRDQTVLIPYRGILRGPVGVLSDRYGNSLDRSLLLAELFQLAGHEVRLARATLTEMQARELLKRTAAAPKPSPRQPRQPAQSSDDFAQTHVRRFGGDAEQIRGRLTEVRDAAEAAWRETTHRASVQSSALVQALGSRLKHSGTTTLETQVADIRDHWWVQQRTDKGWVDFDLAGTGVRSEDPLVNATSVTTPAQIGDDLRHRVRIRVMIERAVGGRLEENVVLDHVLRVTDVGGMRVVLGHSPGAVPSDATLEEQDPLVQLNRYVYDQEAWTPFLVVGTSQVVQSSFTLSGEILPFGTKIDIAPDGGTIADALSGGDAFGTGSDEPQTSERLTAEFLDYEFLVPGQASRIERRTLFDWVGPSVRSARDPQKIASIPPPPLEARLDLANETDILIIGAQPSPEFVAYLTGHAFLRIGRAAVQLQKKPSEIAQTIAAEKTDPLPPSAILLSLALGRGESSPIAERVRIAEPTIFSLHSGVKFDPETGYRLWAGLDIVANDVDVGPASDVDPALIRLEQGVFDTNVEALLAGGDSPPNVADLMSMTGVDASSWETLSDAGQLGSASDWPADARSRLSLDIDRGFVAVVPKSITTLPAMWWRVNPATGLTLGIGDRGWGSAAVEDVQLRRTLIKAATIGLCATYSLFKRRYLIGALCVVGGGFSVAGIARLGPLAGARFAEVADLFGLIAGFCALLSL